MTDRAIPYCVDCIVKMVAKRPRGGVYLCVCPVCKKEIRVETESERRPK